MQPEISRRCLSCGASVRAGARFCPQCGSGLDGKGSSSLDSSGESAKEKARTRESAVAPKQAETVATPAAQQTSNERKADSEAPRSPRGAPPPNAEDSRGAASNAKLAGAVEATRRRAASVVKESIAPRVERVRERSIVILEEPPDDSGLRFVIIAAVLFALFIFFFVLHTVIK